MNIFLIGFIIGMTVGYGLGIFINKISEDKKNG